MSGDGDTKTKVPQTADNRREPVLVDGTLTIADLDAWAEHIRGRFVVEVGIGENGRTRTFFYTNTRAAERCVERARTRGAVARVALVQTIPIGIVHGLGGGAR